MKYVKLNITINRDRLDELLARLAAAGFDEMVINDPQDFLEIKEHPEWYKYDYINEELSAHVDDESEITLYFTDDEEGTSSLERARQLLDELKHTGEAEDISAKQNGIEYSITRTEDDSEWLYRWQEHFKPTHIGERFVVNPSWEEYEPVEGDVVIEMNPGMAFGSGLHETTSLCMRALEKIATERIAAEEAEAGYGLQGLRVLDIGCGTGILSIAAALLGAEDCLGIDIDEDAVRIAKDNVAANGLSDRINIEQGDLTRRVDYAPDIIVANLMADLVIKLAPEAAMHLPSGGIFISSGILDIKCDAVANAVRGEGFEIREIGADGEWRAITAKRL